MSADTTSTTEGIDELPNRDCEWNGENDIDFSDHITSYAGETTFTSADASLDAHVYCTVTGDTDRFLDEAETTEIPVPSTYGGAEGTGPLIETTRGDIRGGSAAGFGFSADRIEAALRLGTNGGNYAAADYRLVAVNHDGVGINPCLFVEAPDGAFIVASEAVPTPEDYRYTSTAEVNGMTVSGEENDGRLAALSETLTTAEEYLNVEFESFSHREKNYFVFEATDGRTVIVDGSTISKITTGTDDAGEIVGEHEVKPYGDEWTSTIPYEITEDDFKLPGDTNYSDDIVVRLTHRSSVKQGRFSGPYAVEATVSYVYLSTSEKDDGNTLKLRVTTPMSGGDRVMYDDDIDQYRDEN